MKKTLLLGVYILLVCGLVGCNKVNEKQVKNIRLECVDICKQQVEEIPFTEKLFNEPEEIRTFINAINKAEKLNGELDYGVYFLMYLSYENGTEKKYVLNISNSDKEGIRGLLVDTAESGRGYSIPEELHKELRLLIYP